MMMNKRFIGTFSDSEKYIFGNVYQKYISWNI